MKPTARPNYAVSEAVGSAPKPVARASLIRQQILFALLEGRYLAQNVALENVDILARRWSSTKTALPATISDRGVRWAR